jgi:hypothetical protein
MVWLPERYPLQSPLVYVCPTPNMVIKSGHSFVDPSGLVHSPCIAHWMRNSDLSSAIQEMAMLFSAEPPLYTKVRCVRACACACVHVCCVLRACVCEWWCAVPAGLVLPCAPTPRDNQRP